MDCKTARSLLVPYLDGELAPAQVTWLDAHRECCASCRQAITRLAAQGERLAALSPPALPQSFEGTFWKQMDANLAEALDGLEADAPRADPRMLSPSPMDIHLSRGAVFVYATLLGMAVAFGFWRHEAATTAEARVQSLRMELERAERLQGTPRPIPTRSERIQTVSFTADRGHF